MSWRAFPEHPSLSESWLLAGTAQVVHHRQVLLKPLKGWNICMFEYTTWHLQVRICACQEKAVPSQAFCRVEHGNISILTMHK